MIARHTPAKPSHHHSHAQASIRPDSHKGTAPDSASVFGPYGQDDEYGSRRLNPMELYHNQVTRTQGAFSLRMFHRSWGLMMIQANIDAPCTLLDFPTLDRFIEEIRTHQYDVIGISSIIPNLPKVKKMCELIRQYQPQRHDRHRRAYRQRAGPGTSGSTPIISSKARASAGSAASWARTRIGPCAIR